MPRVLLKSNLIIENVLEYLKKPIEDHISEKNTYLSGARTHKRNLRAGIQKNFVCFLVQVKIVEFAFEIN